MEMAGTAVGIASLGIQVCHGLLSYYDAWKDYRSDVHRTCDSIIDLSKTLTLLKTSLEDGQMDEERTLRVKKSLQSSDTCLKKLSDKLMKLQSHGNPERFRQKAWSEIQRLYYPFRASTLMKMHEIANDGCERLKLAVQVLQLDVSSHSQKTLLQIDARTATIETFVAQISAQNQRFLATQQSDQFRRIVNWLSPPDPQTNHNSARQRHEPHTGAWFIQSENYQRWKAGHITNLWVHGKAGCGKTVLCSTVIQDIEVYCENATNAGYAMFYFSFSDDRKQSYDSFLRSLVVQLGYNDIGLTMLQQAYEKRQQSLGMDSLQKILLSSIESYNEVFFLLDALDECPEGGEVRQNVLEQLKWLSRSAPNIRILATSRELRGVRESMDELRADAFSISTPAVNADIGRYLSSELSRNQRLGQLDAATKELIHWRVSQKADGMFRWAYCQVQELKKLKSTKPTYITAALFELPSTIDETYERILTEIEEMYRPQALTLLRWLAYARSPLSLRELVEAAIIDPKAQGNVDVDDRGALEDTLNILAGLVTTESFENSGNDVTHSSRQIKGDTKVRLAHFSVKEYLESKRILRTNAKDFYLESSKEQKFLSQSCLTYLLYYSRSSKKTSTEKDLATFPLLRYAAESWYYHASMQQCDEVSRELSLLSSSGYMHDWLLVHQPDDLWGKSFGILDNLGSGLYYASFAGLGPVVNELLRLGTDINHRGGEYVTALGAASFQGHKEIAKRLIEQGANVNVPDTKHRTALHYAVLHKWADCVKLLLDRGAKITTDIDNMTALHLTARIESEEIAQILIDANIPVDSPVQRKVWRSMWKNDRHTWEPRDDHSLTQTERRLGNGLTALHYAVLTGSLTMTRFFLETGANANAQSEYGETCLHLALKQDLSGPAWNVNEDDWNSSHFRIENILDFSDFDNEEEYSTMQCCVEEHRLKILDELLKHDATDFFHQDAFGNSSLHCIRYGKRLSQKAVEKLLDRGVQVDVRNAKGETGLHLACLERDSNAIKALLNHGASISASDNAGLNAVHYVARSADQASMQVIFDEVTQLQLLGIEKTKDNKSRNALHHLFGGPRYADIAAVQYLTQKGVGINDIDDEGYSPLARCLSQYLERSYHKAIIAQHFLQAGADPDFRTPEDSLTLGHLSAREADEIDIELLQVLSRYHIDLQAQDSNGRTILHHCAAAGSLTSESALNFLCNDFGLSVHEYDNCGMTPLDLVKAERQKVHHPYLFRPGRWLETEQLLLKQARSVADEVISEN